MTIRFFIFLVALILSGCSSSKPEAKKEPLGCLGVSAFAMMSDQFQGEACDNFLLIASQSHSCFVTSILWGVFGDNTYCYDRLVEQSLFLNRKLIVQVHLSCEVCRKNGNENEFNLFAGKSISEVEWEIKNKNPKIKERADDVVSKMKRSGVDLILSPGLEFEWGYETAFAFTEILESETISWNPLHDISFPLPPPSVYFESHHYDKQSRGELSISNGDGQDVSFLDGGGITIGGKPPANMSQVLGWGKRELSRGNIVLLWTAKMQGLKQKNSVPLLQREPELTFPDATILIETIRQIEHETFE